MTDSIKVQIQTLRDEMQLALCVGAAFNPELFGQILKPGDNPILRWRDQLDALLAGIDERRDR